MNSESAVDALGALAQEHRLAVFRLLVQAGPAGLPAGSIAKELGLPNSSLSFHLSQLQRSGLIRPRRDGRSLIYGADFEAMDRLIAYLLDNCCQGEQCAVAAPSPAGSAVRSRPPTPARPVKTRNPVQ